MEHHEHSILYEPFNRFIWRHAFGIDVPDHVIMAGLVLVLSLIFFPLMARRISRDNPGPVQQILELVVSGLKGLLHEIIGPHGDRYLYVIGAFTVFIFVSNIFGLFFFLQPPTANPSTTFALAVSSFVYFNVEGIRRQGLLHYLKHFLGPVLWLGPLMFVIEMIGNFARILSLGMRLFGNIFGEHTATSIFTSMVPVIVPWPMMALGIFGAFLQTFVFIMLTMVYISGAVAAEEH
ncbi:MAG TPA: F0F1 ATP synthase subunit A [Thermoanaerobaculia bacterium]|nr:F0F1 ATP synthase subunit A [Thermoanaerobaculia bacterium]